MCAGSRVDSGGFDDHSTILDELLDVCTGVGVADLSLFSGIEPDFAFADAGDAGGQAFLGTEINYKLLGKHRFCTRQNAHPSFVVCLSTTGLISVWNSDGQR